MEIAVRQNQSIFNIAIEQYGSVELAFWIVEDNNLTGLTHPLEAGQKLFIRQGEGDRTMKEVLDGVAIATLTFGAIPEGIGYDSVNNLMVGNGGV